MHLSIVIPDLLWPQPPGGEIDLYQDLRLSALPRLLARAQIRRMPATALEAWLLDRFDSPQAAIASYTLLADAGQPDQTYVMRADPVHLQAQRDQLVLIDPSRLFITPDESTALVTSLNEHFATEGLGFIAPHPMRWYVQLDSVPDLRLQPLPQVAGRSINHALPQGEDSLRWRRRMTEIQMLLHAHPINQTREAQGLPSINSVWFWGGGTISHGIPLATRQEAIWADDPLARGLAQRAGLPQHHLPQQLAELAGSGSRHLVILDNLRPAAWYGDVAAWHQGLHQLESNWIAPLLDAVRRGRLTRLTLHAIGTQGSLAATITPKHRWHFWRRAKSLTHYLPHTH